ncbi:Ig-like domain-containing protein [Dokdonella koreensis]|uniref:Bacterial Ig-like domain-containing protein n=1 Tax=Dokdonella koreensis DS-123 TaxID=1300342 RepID=A0A160DTG1_9GAMM|nr:Ig-like domain-containing protein [Dokdonella koreensis]ANB17260.1 Hypothetical protein I596_1230 [Dokdonella koreensis DS-123]
MSANNGIRAWRAWMKTAGLVAVPLLLSACGASGPMWIPAPLLADASGGVAPSGAYRPFDEALSVGPEDRAELKFSLATLPNGMLRRLTIADGAATVGTEAYALTPEKILRARLVLYADAILEPGYIRVDGAFTPGSDCFADEGTRPVCSETVAGAPIAADADAPTQPLRITQRGYYSFDVTAIVKERIRGGHAGVLRVSSALDAGIGTYGRFEFASKDKVMGQAHVHHQPQLLITLTDAAGLLSATRVTSSVQNVLADPAVADRDFSMDPDLLMNGAPDSPAYALVSPRGIQTGGLTMRSFLNQVGTRGYKVSMTGFVNSGFPSSPAVTPEVAWYRIPNFNIGNARITWNTGWTEPGPGALLATASVRSDIPSQVLAADLSTGYVDALAEAYAQDATTVNFAVAGTTTVPGPVTLDGRRHTGTGHAPRFVTVITPVPTNAPYAFDLNDSTRQVVYCVRHLSSSVCGETLSFRARIGQRFSPTEYIIGVRSVLGETNPEYATPISVAVPLSGPSVDLESDPDPDSQSLAAGFGSLGYQLRVGAANREVGAYQAHVSMPGHNVRAAIAFENLPLPSAVLSGPVRVVIPAGASAAAVPADAAEPFVLNVEDAVVNANIDDTTVWRFASSDASDTLPGEVQRTHGSVPLPMTFGSPGPRTITVTSKGDASITATFSVIVERQSVVTLVPQGAIPVFGQPLTLSAQVADNAGAPVVNGTVRFQAGTTVLAEVPLAAGAADWTTSSLAVGVHAVTAVYDGDPDSFLTGSASAEALFAVDRARTAMTLTAPASVLVGDPVDVTVSLGVVAPGAGAPGGTVVVDDGEASCQFELASASGCTLTPSGSGLRTLTATYPGDVNFLGTQALAPLAVLERAVLSAALDDGRGYARYGRVVDYAVTLRNDGLGAATSVPVEATLSAAFDGAYAQWQCFGAGAGALCAAGGSGPLNDVATIPPGRSLTWLVSVPILRDTAAPDATLALDVGGHAPTGATDINTLVLLRDGLDDPYADGTQILGADAEAILAGTRVHAFVLPPATGRRIDAVLVLRGRALDVRVERTGLDAATALVRLAVHDAHRDERVTPWARVGAAAPLALSALVLDEGVTTLLLEGAETPAAMTVGSAK